MDKMTEDDLELLLTEAEKIEAQRDRLLEKRRVLCARADQSGVPAKTLRQIVRLRREMAALGAESRGAPAKRGILADMRRNLKAAYRSALEGAQ